MHTDMNVIQSIELFSGICAENIGIILNCAQSNPQTFAEGEYIIKPNTELNKIAIVVSGKAHVVSEDFWGNRTIISEVGEGEIFGEAHAIVLYEIPTYGVVAQCPTTVLFLDAGCIHTPCKEMAACHTQLLNNLLRILARKNISYMQKMDHISKRSTRQKLLSYFSEQMNKHHSYEFDIPFNRQQLADYLSVDRSAMSSELSKMQKDGLIRYNLNHFELLGNDYHEA